jgi:hypothetical protein
MEKGEKIELIENHFTIPVSQYLRVRIKLHYMTLYIDSPAYIHRRDLAYPYANSLLLYIAGNSVRVRYSSPILIGGKQRSIR